jgi:hypothetical protein
MYIRHQATIGRIEDRVRLPLYIAFLGSHIRNIFSQLPLSDNNGSQFDCTEDLLQDL